MAKKSRDGLLYVVTGSSRSGKTAWIKQRIEREKRLFIWDPKPDYAAGHHPLKGVTVIRTKQELFKAAQTKGPGRFAFVTRTDPLLFDWWARCAYVFARLQRAVLVAEETADVTHPGKAPPGYGELCRKVLGTGSDLYAVTQRPAESDKTAFGNATIFHCGRMARAKDRVYMGAEMDIDPLYISRLEPLQFIEKDMRNFKVIKGEVRFK